MDTIKIIIETPKGSREKYDYEPVLGFFLLKKALPQGMCFPYDFGFIPGTKGEDGDPLDAIVISEFKTFPGCMIECRVIGCMEARQTEKGKKKEIKNDRFLAIPGMSLAYRQIKKIKEIQLPMLQQLQDFFINYNRAEGKTFEVLQWGDVNKAQKLIAAASSS